MKYNVTNKTGKSCTISLIPETTVEENLIKTSKDENTFLFYYISALEKHVSPDAAFLSLLEYSSFPSPVTVAYQIAKGLGR